MINEDLITATMNWATNKGITIRNGATLKGQKEKFLEEFGEFIAAVLTENQEAIIMEAGDVLVTIICYLKLKQYTAYDIYEAFKTIEPLENKELEEAIKLVLTEINRNNFNLSLFGLVISILQTTVGADMNTCLSKALEKITKRTGKIENGKFVKDKEVQEEQQEEDLEALIIELTKALLKIDNCKVNFIQRPIPAELTPRNREIIINLLDFIKVDLNNHTAANLEYLNRVSELALQKSVVKNYMESL